MGSSVARFFSPALDKTGLSKPDDQKSAGPAHSTARGGAPQHRTERLDTGDFCPAISHTDETLIALVCEGNREALAALFRRYARNVRGVAYRVLRDAAEADDLLQDIFLLVHRLCGTFDSSKGSVRLWILKMTYRRAISRRRYLTSRHFYSIVDIDDVAETLKDLRAEKDQLETSFAGLLEAGRLEQAFERLSEGQRQTISLHFVEGYTFEEIASKLGQSRGNIKHHYFRGLDRLRKQLFSGKL